MATYVEVNRKTFCDALDSIGFIQDHEAKGELVYMRQHHLDSTMWIKIYTSLSISSNANTRARGTDAIRVLLIFKNEKTGKSGCLFKCPRVNRVGTESDVIKRTIERARDAYREGNKRVKSYLKKD